LRVSYLGGIGSLAVAGIMLLGAVLYYLREQASGVFMESATGDPLSILPPLAVVLAVVAVPFFLQAKLEAKPPEIQRVAMVVIAGCVAALLMGFVLSGVVFTPGGVWWNSYGFPVAWRVDIMVSCPPFCNSSDQTIYNPLFYAMDALFYISIGFSAVLIGSRQASKLASFASNERIGLSEVRTKEIESASPS
jgi:hypothetical protein